MKKRTEQRLALVLFVASMLIAGAAYAMGFVKVAFQIAGVNVAIYPVAFLALVGVVQLVGAYLPIKKRE